MFSARMRLPSDLSTTDIAAFVETVSGASISISHRPSPLELGVELLPFEKTIATSHSDSDLKPEQSLLVLTSTNVARKTTANSATTIVELFDCHDSCTDLILLPWT